MPRSWRAAVIEGLERALPLTLELTFLLVPSTSTRIFKTFLCDPYEYDRSSSDVRSYMQDDLRIRCETSEYDGTFSTAVVMLLLWPVGVPLLYSVLLYLCRDAFLRGKPSRLVEHISFLSGDYKDSAFWWEPFEMCRKLTLTGWVLLIGYDSEQARVLIALLVSITFLALHFTIKPLHK